MLSQNGLRVMTLLALSSLLPVTNTATPVTPGKIGSRFTFDTDTIGRAPAGFVFARTGKGHVGQWVVLVDSTAPSRPYVLAQMDSDQTDYRFPVAVVADSLYRDCSVSVRCKTVAGKVDQACGLVFRYQNENNYYITRANALENNIRLYYVKDGRRTQIASFSGPVRPKVWHDYRVDVSGDQIEVYWDGKRVIDIHDPTFPGAGRVGVWTKADSITEFDDLVVVRI